MTRFFPALATAALLACAAALPAPAAQLGDDGLHKAPWMHDTFKDLREDLAEANAAGQRLLILIEQRGCIYCTKMHEEVFPQPEIEKLLTEDYFVIQINMFGDVEVTDFDGTALPEKDMVRRWGMLFTPTMIFLPEEAGDLPAPQDAVAVMPGAFEKGTTRHMLQWVLEKGYQSDEPFQKYHARKLEEDRAKN
ncbi:thioredoxin family protein [Alloyangia pacifica]|uniref:Thioredoxin-related protein n=1 Tax=Alloyangia pacifica TaxID=311180 RepID=A0A1I6QXM3_9RHOB|nr:thioredoxin family protein [Alloyangia pacifica]SDG03834.1 Thioredoxin-related protein [Alloyangia pacifica]SFS57153.1 Thioredoxin-related protein [Alloyangia pacifica]